MANTAELALADRYCRYLTRHHYENFWVASLFAPRHARLHLHRLYAYCRTTDDLGDENGNLAELRLALWRQDVERCFGGQTPPLHPILFALADSIRTRKLPAEPFFDLIAANLQDQRVTEYATWDELRGYCELSAAPVGRLVLRIFGIVSPDLDALADDVCIGLQLANFAQDVSIDRAKGRTYLLQSDLHERGEIGAIVAMCERAGDLLASGYQLEAAVDKSLRRQLSLYRLGGQAILRAIAEAGYRTDLKRPEVSLPVKFGLLAQVGMQWMGRAEHVRDIRMA